jgi:hypothetical protein
MRNSVNTAPRDDIGGGLPSDLVVSSLLMLISRYATAAADGAACTRLAVSIQCHLELLSERADVPALVRDTCGLLVEEWRERLASAERLPCRSDLRALVSRAQLR